MGSQSADTAAVVAAVAATTLDKIKDLVDAAQIIQKHSTTRIEKVLITFTPPAIP